MKRAAALSLFRGVERAGECTRREHVGNVYAQESQVLKAVLEALARHPKVAWRRRINSGFQMLPDKDGGERPFRSGFVGCSDIIGQLRATYGGRFLAVECKSSRGAVTDAQEAFLDAVRAAGGVAFIARSVDDVFRELGSL